MHEPHRRCGGSLLETKTRDAFDGTLRNVVFGCTQGEGWGTHIGPPIANTVTKCSVRSMQTRNLPFNLSDQTLTFIGYLYVKKSVLFFRQRHTCQSFPIANFTQGIFLQKKLYRTESYIYWCQPMTNVSSLTGQAELRNSFHVNSVKNGHGHKFFFPDTHRDQT